MKGEIILLRITLKFPLVIHSVVNSKPKFTLWSFSSYSNRKSFEYDPSRNFHEINFFRSIAMLLHSQRWREREKKKFHRTRIRRKSRRLKNLWNSQRSTIEETKRRKREERKKKKRKRTRREGLNKRAPFIRQRIPRLFARAEVRAPAACGPVDAWTPGEGKWIRRREKVTAKRSRTWRPFRPRRASSSSFRYRPPPRVCFSYFITRPRNRDTSQTSRPLCLETRMRTLCNDVCLARARAGFGTNEFA